MDSVQSPGGCYGVMTLSYHYMGLSNYLIHCWPVLLLQARTQELAKQLSVAHAEISRLNSDLSQARKEAEKMKKKSEILETRVKDSTTKMISMEEQRQKAAAAPVPKPRGDLTQLKTERERLEMELATARSNHERERSARDGAESELQEMRRKMQEMIMKQSQLVSQLGTGAGGEGGVPRSASLEEEKRLERSLSEKEERMKGKESELRQMQMEVERLKREKSQDEAALGVLEKERKEAIDAKIEMASKLASVSEEMTTLKNTTSKTKSTPAEVRLNEYAGKLVTLEERYNEEKNVSSLFIVVVIYLSVFCLVHLLFSLHRPKQRCRVDWKR